MKDFLGYLVENIVSSPSDVVVEENLEGSYDTLTLRVAPSDMGQIIGKGGRIIKSLRDLLRLYATKNGLRANLILQEG